MGGPAPVGSISNPSNLKENELRREQPSRSSSGIGEDSGSLQPAKAERRDLYTVPPPISPAPVIPEMDGVISTIPTFDFDGLTQSERLEEAKRFAQAFNEVGFVAVKAPELSKILPKAYEEMGKFFHQDLKAKKRCWTNTNGQSGYSPAGNETAAGQSVADHKETFFVQPAEGGLDRVWPEELPEFQSSMEESYNLLRERAISCMKILMEGLGVATDKVDQSINNAGNLLRLAYYPAMEFAEKGAVSAAEHMDLNAITILPRPTEKGLRVRQRNGEWLDVHVPEGYVIVNGGEQLEIFTRKEARGAPHEVRISNPYIERLAIIFFASFAQTDKLVPFAQCEERMTKNMSAEEKEEFNKQFPSTDATVNDNLISRLIEMGTIKDPDEGMVRRLRGLNLLQNPPQSVKEKFGL